MQIMSVTQPFSRGHVREHKHSVIGKRLRDVHNLGNKDLRDQFTILKKRLRKLDCLSYEMLFIKNKKPTLNTQSDSIKAKVFGYFPLWQRFRKFRSEFNWKGPFGFLPTGIFGITSGGGPLISVGIFRSKFALSFLTNRFFALIREFGNDKKWRELFLLVDAV